MAENIEEKIKIDNEIINLKREHKYAFENLNRLKSDTAEIISTKERITREIAERTEELNKVLLEISSAKLQWINERQAEIDKLAEKEAQAENVIKRKAELNTQEETIRQIEAKNTDILNETRRLELKLKEKETELDVHEKNVLKLKKSAEEESQKSKEETRKFKMSILKLFKTVENL